MKKINIILEQVLKRLIEAEEEKPAATPDSAADKGGESGGGDEEKKLRDLLKQDYDTFVNKLKVDATDKKFQDAIKSLAGKNKIEHKEMSIKVSDLIPTQNEIDVDKSLKFPLTNPKSAKQCLDGGSIAVAGKRIITAGGGKYIIDGHHRWSQVCAMNPDAEIQAVDLSDITDPFEALKATQLGIAADIGKIETQSVKGTNLLKIGKDDLKRYVIATMTDDVAKVFSESGKVSGDLVAKSVQNKKDQEKPETPEKSEETPVTERAKGKLYSVKKKGADLIWRNVQEMQSKNQPVSGAPKRDIMPQTDNAKNWLNTAPDVADIKEQRALLMKRAGIKK